VALFKLAKGSAGTSLIAGRDIYAPARQAIKDTSWGQRFDPESEADLILVKEILALRLKVGQQWIVRTERPRLRPETQALHIVTIAVARFPDFPSRRQLEDAVVERWGGGAFQIWAAIPSKRVHTLSVDGEMFDPEDPVAAAKARAAAAQGGRRGAGSDIDEALLSMVAGRAAEWLENHPAFQDKLMIAYIARTLKIPLGDDEAETGKGRKRNDPDDAELQAFLDSNPKAQEMRAAASLAKKYGGSPKDYLPKVEKDDPYEGLTPFERAMRKKLDQIGEEMAEDMFEGRGGRRKGEDEGGSWSGVVTELLKKVDPNPLVEAASEWLKTATAKGGGAPALSAASPSTSTAVGALPAPAQAHATPSQAQPEPAASPPATGSGVPVMKSEPVAEGEAMPSCQWRRDTVPAGRSKSGSSEHLMIGGRRSVTARVRVAVGGAAEGVAATGPA
jgi:hypothetical protein